MTFAYCKVCLMGNILRQANWRLKVTVQLFLIFDEFQWVTSSYSCLWRNRIFSPWHVNFHKWQISLSQTTHLIKCSWEESLIISSWDNFTFFCQLLLNRQTCRHMVGIQEVLLCGRPCLQSNTFPCHCWGNSKHRARGKHRTGMCRHSAPNI